MQGIVIGIVIIYLGIMLFIGYLMSKRISSNDDFALAGRKLGPWLIAGTLAATNIGGGSSLGITEKAYGDWGLSAIWYVITAAIAYIVLAWIAPKIRSTMSKTVSDFFSKRYGKANGLLTAIIMVLPMIGLTAVQIMASSTILSVMTGWDYKAAVIVVTLIVTVYSVMGGLWGVVMTDFIQCALILVGTALAIPFALSAAGGWDNVIANVPAEKLSWISGAGWKTIISLTFIYIASFSVGPEVIQRYQGGKDTQSVKSGSILGGVICIVYALLPAVLGLIALAMVNEGTLSSDQIMTHGARYALPTLAIQTMPPILVGILFSALISATLSSADSDMLAAGTIVSNDIYKEFIDKDASDKQLLFVNKAVMIGCGVLSLFIALAGVRELVTILMFSFSLRAAGAFIPYIIGHYWHRGGAVASITSIIVGSATFILANQKVIPTYGMEPLIPAIVLSFIVFIVLAYIIPAEKKLD